MNVTGVERGRARIGGGSKGSAGSLYAFWYESALGKYAADLLYLSGAEPGRPNVSINQ